jgi:hypothetical protein
VVFPASLLLPFLRAEERRRVCAGAALLRDHSELAGALQLRFLPTVALKLQVSWPGGGRHATGAVALDSVRIFPVRAVGTALRQVRTSRAAALMSLLFYSPRCAAAIVSFILHWPRCQKRYSCPALRRRVPLIDVLFVQHMCSPQCAARMKGIPVLPVLR